MATIIRNGKRWRAQVRKFGVSKSTLYFGRHRQNKAKGNSPIVGEFGGDFECGAV